MATQLTMQQLPHEEEAGLLAEKPQAQTGKGLVARIVTLVGVASAVVVLTACFAPIRQSRVRKTAFDVQGTSEEAVIMPSPKYTEHPEHNVYYPYGGIDIDIDPTHVDSADACKDRCTADEKCDCVTFFPKATGESLCWKRRACILDNMVSPYNEGFTVFMKENSFHPAMTGQESLYDVFPDKNAYAPFGALDIDNAEGVAVSSPHECLQRCTDDDRCDCVTFGIGRCWTRCNCEVDKMTSPYNEGHFVFKKKKPAKGVCPLPCSTSQEFMDDAKAKLRQFATSPPVITDSNLVWSDEFDSAIDDGKWDVREDGDVVNDEAQMYRKGGGNSFTVEGHLTLKGKCESYNGASYTSAKLHSRQMFRAGVRVEARLRMSTGKGTWPAFWLMGSGKDPWPKVGEIDIMEYTGCNPGRVMGNLHYEHRHGDWPMQAYMKHQVDVSVWHTYAVDWLSSGMIFYVDGAAVGMIPAQQCVDDWPYNKNEFFIILNLALGGTLGGWCLNEAVPECDQSMDVDWLRVWKIE